MEMDTQTHLESLVELGLSSTVSTILTQCSTEIYKVAHTHMHAHTRGYTLVLKVTSLAFNAINWLIPKTWLNTSNIGR